MSINDYVDILVERNTIDSDFSLQTNSIITSDIYRSIKWFKHDIGILIKYCNCRVISIINKWTTKI